MFWHKRSLLLFLLPGLTGVLLFYVAPFLGGAYYSFTDGSAQGRFVGLTNYAAVLGNRMFRLGLKNSFILSLLCAPTVWLMGFVTAELLHKIKSGARTLRGMILMPYIMPSSAIVLIWLLLFDFGGPINRLNAFLGLERIDFLSGQALRLPVVLLFIWKNLGFAVIVFLSAMQAIPRAYYEFATLEGAGFLRQLRSITLPSVLPTCFLVFILEWINAFKIFKEVYFIGGAYPDFEVYTLQNYMNNMYGSLNYQNVTTAAYTFTLMLFVFFGILFSAQKLAMGTREGE